MGHTSLRAGHWPPTLQIPGNEPIPDKEEVMVTRLHLAINPEHLMALDPLSFDEDELEDFGDEDELEVTDPDGVMLSPIRSASPLSEES